MPKIIVVSELGGGGASVTLEERVEQAHLDDEHSAAQLVERLGWAIVDAEQNEAADEAAAQRRRPLPRHYAPAITEWTRQAGDTLAA